MDSNYGPQKNGEVDEVSQPYGLKKELSPRVRAVLARARELYDSKRVKVYYDYGGVEPETLRKHFKGKLSHY